MLYLSGDIPSQDCSEGGDLEALFSQYWEVSPGVIQSTPLGNAGTFPGGRILAVVQSPALFRGLGERNSVGKGKG